MPLIKRKTIGLAEVIIGTLIIGIAAGSLLAVFLSVRKYIERANNRIVAANLARGYLNRMPLLVSSGAVNLTAPGVLFPPQVIDGYTYSGNYTVINHTLEGYNSTEVVVNITYYPLD